MGGGWLSRRCRHERPPLSRALANILYVVDGAVDVAAHEPTSELRTLAIEGGRREDALEPERLGPYEGAVVLDAPHEGARQSGQRLLEEGARVVPMQQRRGLTGKFPHPP